MEDLALPQKWQQENYVFYENKRTEHKHKCVDDVISQMQADLRFNRDAKQLPL